MGTINGANGATHDDHGDGWFLEPVTVTLRPQDAQHVARVIQSEIAGLGTSIAREHGFRDPQHGLMICEALAGCAAELDVLEWGEPDSDVTFTAPWHRLSDIGEGLLRSGTNVDFELHEVRSDAAAMVEQYRDRISEAEAGAAILSQLASTESA